MGDLEARLELRGIFVVEGVSMKEFVKIKEYEGSITSLALNRVGGLERDYQSILVKSMAQLRYNPARKMVGVFLLSRDEDPSSGSRKYCLECSGWDVETRYRREIKDGVKIELVGLRIPNEIWLEKAETETSPSGEEPKSEESESFYGSSFDDDIPF